MTDDEYRAAKDRLTKAWQYIAHHEGEILAEAVRRDEAYVLHAWYHHVRCEWPYLTLNEALDRAGGAVVPEFIVGPGGVKYDPFTGEEEEQS